MADSNSNTNPAEVTSKNNLLNFRERSARMWISIAIVILSGLVLIFLITFGIWRDDELRVKDLFGLVLPVVGTWMGTVLAFYFSKDNYESANNHALNLIKATTTDGKLKELNASEVMITPASFAFRFVKDEDEFKNIKLVELSKSLEQLQTERLPVLQKDTNQFIFLIYRSTIDRFISGFSLNQITLPVSTSNTSNTPKATSDLTVGDMYNSDFKLFKDILALNANANFFLPATATLDQVRELMKDNSICQDVFITKSGKKDDGVIGWITNSIVVERCDVFTKAN